VFDHVTIRASDREASERFYGTVLAVLGTEKTHDDARFVAWDDFSIAQTRPEHPVTHGLHVGFAAASRDVVDAFHRAGAEAGYRDDGAPGPRPRYRDDYYGGFLLDPDDNSAEAVHHGGMRGGGIDHVWIRVADVAAARRFYETIAPYSGFALTDGAHFAGPRSSFSLLEGTPSEHIHMAFPATEDATVDAFHKAATDAGYRDNGAPGERPIYHPGYYAAFVFDPDGHNIEVVNHNR
jgi:catechol 2,3-dioxygenase-like lactoylglutathione lyase family enzyme